MVTLTLLHPQHQTPLKQWHFERESLIRVGRALENHVVLEDPLVSRQHLELRRVDVPDSPSASSAKSCWHLVNYSSNGTFLNGFVVSQETICEDVVIQLAVGGPTLRFHLSAPTQPITKSPQLPVIPKPAVKSIAQLPVCTHSGNAPKNLFCIHCGQPVTVEKTVCGYQVLRVLGKGGMGTTYLIWDATRASPGGRQPGALKVLKEMNTDMAKIPKAQELFEREATTLQTLDHPGIPKFYDFFVDAGKKYLVMELLHGQDLEKWVRQHGPVSPQQAIAWIIQTCDVLDYLHNRKVPIIHRDIKPGNLLVKTLTKRIVVLDFGAVKAVGQPSGTRIGAEGYSAPEQTQGRPVTQSDCYAIGPCLILLLTGKYPNRLFRSRSQGYRYELDVTPAISPRLQKVIERTTQPNPNDRYRTARELAQALKECL